MTISAAEARRRLYPLIKEVNDDRVAIEITSRHGNAVLMAAEEFSSWKETMYLFSTPNNARRLRAAYDRAKSGQYEEHPLDLDDQ